MVGDPAIMVEVEATIDALIRSFKPGDQKSYVLWDGELTRLEMSIQELASSSERQYLFASVRAQRVGLAFDVDKHEKVIELSDQFVCDVPVSHPSFFSVATLRARSLHSVGSHGVEVQELLELARKPEIQGGEYVSILEHLASLHPVSISDDIPLFEKMKSAIDDLRGIGYETLRSDIGEIGIAELALQIASELRKINRDRGEALLAEET